jgi:hypothetical protein
MPTQMREPLTILPTLGTNGRSSRATPTKANVHLYGQVVHPPHQEQRDDVGGDARNVQLACSPARLVSIRR